MAQTERTLTQSRAPTPPAQWRLAWSALDTLEAEIKHVRNLPGASEVMDLILKLRAGMTAMLKESGHDA